MSKTIVDPAANIETNIRRVRRRKTADSGGTAVSHPPEAFKHTWVRTDPPPLAPTDREIRDRAYYIYLARGGRDGCPQQDWTQAERELHEEYLRAKKRYESA